MGETTIPIAHPLPVGPLTTGDNTAERKYLMTKRFEQLTPELAASQPIPGTVVPQQMRFTEDGQALFYLLSDTGTLALSLWRYDVVTRTVERLAGPPSDQNWSTEEELRRERTRMVWEGITSYQVMGKGLHETLLIPQGGSLFIKTGGEPLREIPGIRDAVDPILFPNDPSRVAYVLGDEVWVANTTTGVAQPITEGALPGITHGLAEYAAQEELGRTDGFWVSPDGTYLAFEEADVRHIPLYPIVHWEAQQAFVENHRYPLVGQPNAKVRLGVTRIEDGTLRWLDLGEADQYLARVVWASPDQLAVMMLTRDHHRLEWRLYDVSSGAFRILFAEESPLWVNVGDDTRFLESGDVLTSSEASGYRHLWWYSDQSGDLRQITHGEFEVQRLLGYDAERRLAYVTATKETPLEVHVYQVNVASGEMVRLSQEPGMHQAEVAPDFGHWVDQASSAEMSAATRLLSFRTDAVHVIHGSDRLRPGDLGLVPPEFVTLTLKDGTILHGALYEPERSSGDSVPAIVAVYGGTHAQTVLNAWGLTVDLQAQLLRQKGYLVFKLDNRGSYHRGKAFEGALHRNFSTVEVEDQVAGVRWLVDNRGVDPTRIGIYGWSYGGYMTLMGLLKAPDVFKVGVSGAPVTDFRLYDTAYTERYMETAETNLAGYVEGSVLPLVDRLSGHLLIIHGLLDENVHFRHTALLMDALNRAEKDYDLVVLPYSRHAVRGYHNVLTVIRRRTQYFEKNL